MDEIIKSLNKKKNISSIGAGNVEDLDLTEAEVFFIRTFNPGKSLIVYGTLAPGAPNHSVIEHIKGNWRRGIVRGKLTNKGWGAELGYYGFKHAPKEQEEIKVVVLLSDELISNWQLLDEFEGNGYRRILAKYELEDGQVGVGNIYAINEE